MESQVNSRVKSTDEPRSAKRFGSPGFYLRYKIYLILEVTSNRPTFEGTLMLVCKGYIFRKNLERTLIQDFMVEITSVE